ncbi:hypothetical protein KAM341_43680 [Aeromonas caviae]|nr:hypothetical protein KAM341_43680 [Aeromonas caviae]
MGEGAGILVIEELEHALARGATPIVELVGYGTTADAYHMTAGPEDGDGAKRAMQAAIRQAGINASEIQHLNAHATSTPVGDKGELAAIKAVFGTENRIAVTSTKSATGHLLGAAGGIEAIFTALALRDQIAPATRNFEQPDPFAEGVDVVHGAARPMPILITTMIQPFRTTLKWFCSGGLNHGQKQGSISKKHEHSYLYSALWR